MTNDELAGGLLVEHEEVRASVARLLVVAKKMMHSDVCAAWRGSKCNCPRGELIAGLKEMAK